MERVSCEVRNAKTSNCEHGCLLQFQKNVWLDNTTWCGQKIGVLQSKGYNNGPSRWKLQESGHTHTWCIHTYIYISICTYWVTSISSQRTWWSHFLGEQVWWIWPWRRNFTHTTLYLTCVVKTTCCVKTQGTANYDIIPHRKIWCKKAHNTRSVKHIWYKHSGTDFVAASAVYSQTSLSRSGLYIACLIQQGFDAERASERSEVQVCPLLFDRFLFHPRNK